MLLGHGQWCRGRHFERRLRTVTPILRRLSTLSLLKLPAWLDRFFLPRFVRRPQVPPASCLGSLSCPERRVCCWERAIHVSDVLVPGVEEIGSCREGTADYNTIDYSLQYAPDKLIIPPDSIVTCHTRIHPTHRQSISRQAKRIPIINSFQDRITTTISRSV